MNPTANTMVSQIFRETADLLSLQGGDPSRVQAYLRAADQLDRLDADIRAIWERSGREGLVNIPKIGASLAASIEEILDTGRSSTLDRLRGQLDPEQLFQRLPGIGATLAGRIHNQLHIDTLEEVEAAAHDGRLASVRGIGTRRAKLVAAYLEQSLGNSMRRGAHGRPSHTRHQGPPGPPVDLLLSIDHDYRARAENGTLKHIAPRRFNPEGKAWLPIWHGDRDDWSFTAMYSNTARAHQLGKTRDWVVIYVERGGVEEQYTVVTEYEGRLEGLRVVRGLEEQCLELYSRPLPVRCEVINLTAANNNKMQSRGT